MQARGGVALGGRGLVAVTVGSRACTEGDIKGKPIYSMVEVEVLSS